ncbi:hypothetical protein CSB69_1017 [Morganella morganii]|nr:hypothetical protein CSB69_1017 [Morganella morganii]
MNRAVIPYNTPNKTTPADRVYHPVLVQTVPSDGLYCMTNIRDYL